MRYSDDQAPSLDASHFSGMLVIIAIASLVVLRYLFDS